MQDTPNTAGLIALTQDTARRAGAFAAMLENGTWENAEAVVREAALLAQRADLADALATLLDEHERRTGKPPWSEEERCRLSATLEMTVAALARANRELQRQERMI